MKALIAILLHLQGLGITLADFTISTHINDTSYWDCDAYAQPDATIVVCPADNPPTIHIVR